MSKYYRMDVCYRSISMSKYGKCDICKTELGVTYEYSYQSRGELCTLHVCPKCSGMVRDTPVPHYIPNSQVIRYVMEKRGFNE